ncbi:uncharacterized protein TRIVIDRAFT_212643 [Trichoderma virens Gv29-8]|uniref:Uncharacterized protein n=1 Tax=Hypocrea virens (strain Gv29-8 / FGSC 10586) TaxID=413071 RepID=G9MPF6_HYPVG|nr:uncharacterized protein TRIVIDRAFT_212643 [Trichoderma virens Gv29-8]EHK23757.1 hypothetical protein TRIVIDRAFT_212643 [Trichoderma virens Gv29-8]
MGKFTGNRQADVHTEQSLVDTAHAAHRYAITHATSVPRLRTETLQPCRCACTVNYMRNMRTITGTWKCRALRL